MKEVKHNMREWLLRASCIVIMMMAMLTGTLAQPPRGRFSPKEFRAHLEEYVSKEAGLTASEAKAFFPLFHEMKEKQTKAQDEIFRLKRNGPASNASDKEFANAIQKIKNLEVEKAETEEVYYKKMCKAISARKVFLVMQAEDKFHRRMINNFNRQGRNRK